MNHAAGELAIGHSYETTRLNAVRHGVTSRFAVLPWEDRAEYDALLEAFAAEHRPQGPTEAHLVEELAGILWRKRRLHLAEHAHFADRMEEVTEKSGYGFGRTELELNRAAFDSTPETTAAELEDHQADRAMTAAALAVLVEGAPDAYRRALDLVREDTRGWWHNVLTRPEEYLEDDEPRYSADAAGLRRFLAGKVKEFYVELENDLAGRPARRLRVMGAAWPLAPLETLARYEVHLDRKFERTLALLFRLQQARGVLSVSQSGVTQDAQSPCAQSRSSGP